MQHHKQGAEMDNEHDEDMEEGEEDDHQLVDQENAE